MSHSNLSQYEQNEYGHPSVESGDLTTMNKKMTKKKTSPLTLCTQIER